MTAISIGIILLMGLVAKSSILPVEFVNQLRRRGLDVREAILDLEAGPIQLPPIMGGCRRFVCAFLPC